MAREFRFCSFCGHRTILKRIKSGEPSRHVCEACDFIHFLSPKLAAGVILLHEEKIVLTRRAIEPGQGLWSYPGGFVERGETVPDAARREALEEVHAQVELQDLLGVYSYPDSIVVIVMYRAQNRGSKPRPGDEVNEVGFFSPDEIPWEELAFSSVKDSLRDFIQWTS